MNSRSSLATTTEHLAERAAARAAANCGRRSSASAPLPLSASIYSPMTSSPFGEGEPLDRGALRLKAQAWFFEGRKSREAGALP